MSWSISADRRTALVQVLEQARELGFLGPGPVEDHLLHARRFLAAIEPEPREVLDLGSGGGVPGLILASHWATSHLVLLDAAERRTMFLAHAVEALGLGERVEVWRGRAEVLSHQPECRGRFDLVVARSFGPPPVVAECGAGFLEVGGRLAVSEPPDVPGTPRRVWLPDGLARLGLDPPVNVGGVAVMVQARPCPDEFPRRVGVPAKRPLF